jgi:hypothetical protein
MDMKKIAEYSIMVRREARRRREEELAGNT